MRGPCPTFELRSLQSAGHMLAPQIHVERVNEFLNQFLISGGVRAENGDFNKDFKASDRELIQMVFKKWSSYGFLRWEGGEGVDRPGNVVGLESVFLCVLGDFDPDSVQLPKYLRCYRCLLETKELGCLLGSDICLAPPGSSCMTLLIKNSELLVFGSTHSRNESLSCTPCWVPATSRHCSPSWSLSLPAFRAILGLHFHAPVPSACH